jgi:hypothetical protein
VLRFLGPVMAGYKGFPTKVKQFPRLDASRSDGSRNAFLD